MLFSRFVKDCSAGVAPLVALSIVPLITGVGAAIDYTRASAARTALQNSLDATALMLSKEAPTTSATQLQADATAYIDSLFTRPDTTGVSVTATYSSMGGSQVLLTGTTSMNTTFMRLMGYDQIDIKASATAKWGNTRLRVALVLDNTGSMADDGKMDALVTASHNLLAQLQSAAANPDDVYISIIPFSKDVNLGSGNYQQSWLRWDLWDAVNGTCSDTSRHTQNSCLSHGKIWTPADHSTWNGCVTDRDQNFDTTNDAPVAGSTLYPAEQYNSCSAPVLSLSNDWTALSNKIDAMKPAGNTNQAIGLQVGWQSLTAAPFTVPATDAKYQYQQVIILLTDGLNTEDRWYSTASSIDTRESKTCANIKNAGITIYTVQVNTGGDPKSQLLEDCASSKSKFYLLTSADGIVTTFSQIGTALTNLRLAM